MPPAKKLARHPDYASSVHDLTSTHVRDLHKPYSQSTSLERTTQKKKSEGLNGLEKKYMQLDEFLEKSQSFNSSRNDENPSRNDEGSSRNEEQDYPKPNVNLFNSLLTLSKLIQNQKQFIKNLNTYNTSSEEPLEDNFNVIDLSSSTSTNFENEEDNVTSSMSSTNNVSTSQSPIQTLSTTISSSMETCSIKSFSSSQTISSTTIATTSSSLEKTTFESFTTIESKRGNIPEEIKDEDYRDRRKRNNLAAKKSREERRKKELEVIEATKKLEIENSKLTLMLKRLTSRNEMLESRYLDLYRHQAINSSSSSSLSTDNS